MMKPTELRAQQTIQFPPSSSVPNQTQELHCQTSIVVIGANGAGKSRLGTWLELKGPQKERVHRIAAQRSIVFPTSSSPIGYEAAKKAFHWAPTPANWDEPTFENNKMNLRMQRRYGGSILHAETAPLTDYDALMVLLFSENYENLISYKAQLKKKGSDIPPPESILDKVKDLWESILPHRSLELGGGEIRIKQGADNEKSYPARAMSDGERVIFYLIGQCLCASANSIIVVDEPEIHLHKSIMFALWNSLEKARPDCVFVYLTHDLAFASDRSGATKICLTAYNEESFSWFEVPENSGIPESILLEMLGSRKTVLFVEGVDASEDATLYRAAFPEFTVKPVGGCSLVISSTKVFRSLEEMHHIKSLGIIDRDYLESGQINSYERNGIYTLLVAEVENLYLVPEVIEAVAHQLMLDPKIVLQEVMNFIFDDFERWLPTHAIELTHHKISLMLGRFSSQAKNLEEYSAAFEEFKTEINPERLYNSAMIEARAALENKNYREVLRLFNKKELSKNIGRFFGITKGSYTDKVKEMSKRGLGDINTSIRKYFPKIEDDRKIIY